MTTSTMSSTHDRAHVHDHPHGPEQRPGPSGAGTVVLDIGPGVGAAIVLTPGHMDGMEIEYRAAGDPWGEKHMAVRERQGVGVSHYAAIFGPLPAGPYEFRVRGSEGAEPDLVMTVAPASVATASWPDPG